MAEAEEQLWWYRILHGKVEREIDRKFSDKNISILDAGCGTGGLLNYLKKKGYQQLNGIDISAHALKYSREKGFDVRQGSIAKLSSHFENHKFDVIVSSDVLYFFPQEDFPEIFQDWKKILKPGGIIILNLPALKAFSGMHDISVGIEKRISFSQFKKIINETEYRIASARYWPIFLSPLIFFARLGQRIQMKKKNAEIHSDVKLPSQFINSAFYRITRSEAVLPGLKWGSSLFVILEQNG